MIRLTTDQIKKICPSAQKINIDKYLSLLNGAMIRYDINTPHRVASFLAQILHESGGFMYVKEIASGKAYEGRKDLGNTVEGYGVKYKGRGLIQNTGFFNYKQLAKDFAIDLINKPELLETPKWAVEAACHFWKSHNLNEICETHDVTKVTKIINGGKNGLAERIHYFEKAIDTLIV